jgi:hypothetical protein
MHALSSQRGFTRLSELRIPLQRPGTRGIVTYSLPASSTNDGHDAATRKEIARRLADLAGLAYDGEYDPLLRYSTPPYFVPSDTLTTDMALRLGIRGEPDLFGGVVSHPFMATKTITHPLVGPNAFAPRGWSRKFARRVSDVVLDGYSAFAKEDALVAGYRLLDRGAVRIKLASGIAGLGQFVAESGMDLARILDAVDPQEMASSGVVVEENLIDVVTYSVGQIRVAGIIATYYGTQRLTTNNEGAQVYGGSELTVVRGDFDTLLAFCVADELRIAIAQARIYDHAAKVCFRGFFASRRNYDVAQGAAASGLRRSGVLEQSWRLGGATGAEIGALAALRSDPSLVTVDAMTREVYGERPVLPKDAAIYFSGVDPRVGPLTKYAWIKPNADTR